MNIEDVLREMREKDAEIERLHSQLEYEQQRNANNVALADDEIERLRADLETAERALDAQTDFRSEIEQLREALKAALLLVDMSTSYRREDIAQQIRAALAATEKTDV